MVADPAVARDRYAELERYEARPRVRVWLLSAHRSRSVARHPWLLPSSATWSSERCSRWRGSATLAEGHRYRSGDDWSRLAPCVRPLTGIGWRPAPLVRPGVPEPLAPVRVVIHDRASLASPDSPLPVIMVHGLAVSHGYLMPLATKLAGYRPVHVIGLPGFGLSDTPAGCWTSPSMPTAWPRGWTWPRYHPWWWLGAPSAAKSRSIWRCAMPTGPTGWSWSIRRPWTHRREPPPGRSSGG